MDPGSNKSPNDIHDEANSKYHGIYRARVVECSIEEDGEKNKYAGIRVWIPDIMVDSVAKDMDENSTGIVAYPANFTLGGYNKEDTDGAANFAGSCMVPALHSYVFVFFEGGTLESCFYIGNFQGKLVPVIPECRGVPEPHKVRVLLKSESGRAIIVSDDQSTARVEITGGKRLLDDSEGPQGNSKSVYKIKDNQNTFFLDERLGKEKWLWSSHKEDYINHNIQEQTLEIYFKNDIKIKTDGIFHLQAAKGIEISTDKDLKMTAKGLIDFVAGGVFRLLSSGQLSIKSEGIVAIDGSQEFTNSGKAESAEESSPKPPKGTRD